MHRRIRLFGTVGRMPPPIRTLPILVGRERELGTLGQHLDDATIGRGSLVLIGGEAGVGKTAIAEQLCREAEVRGALVLVGRCYDLTDTPPYGPWVELVRSYAPGPDMPPLPAFFPRWGAASGTVGQAALFAQMQDFLAAVAATRPAVLLLEDLHWADPATLDLLRVLARSARQLPLLLLATYRADELARRHPLHTLLPLLEREAAAARLTVRPLAAGAVRALITARYALAEEKATDLATYLDVRAEGNALFITQLLRALEEEAILTEGAHGWELGDPQRLGMPLPLLEVIDARIARLAEDVQGLLAVAAVIGHEVPLALWAVVAAVTDEVILGAIEPAVAARLLDASADGATARFVHALIREALYAAILPPRRRVLHRSVGEVLATIPAVEPDTVAYHFQRAGDARAVAWLIRAGDRARRAAAMRTAVDRFDAALALLEGMRQGDAAERGWLLLRLGYLRRVLAPGQGVADLDAAGRIAAETGDRALGAAARYYRGIARANESDLRRGVAEMRAGLADLAALPPDERRRVRDALGSTLDHARGALILFLALGGRFAAARDLGERHVPGDVVLGTWFLGMTYAYAALGHPERAGEQMRRAVATDRAGQHYGQLGVDQLSCLTFLTLPYYADDGDAVRRVAEGGEWAWEQANRTEYDVQPPALARLPLLLLYGRWDEIDQLVPALRMTNTSYRALIIDVLGPLARLRGDAAEAWRRVREILPVGPATAPGRALFFVGVRMQRLAAALALDAGDLATARAWLEAHDRWLAWSGAVLGRSEVQALWARYHRLEGDSAQARDCAERALAHATAPRQPLALIAAHRLVGALDTAAGRYEDAHTHLAASLILADACAAPFERSSTLLAMAECSAATGAVPEAMARLGEVRAICAPLGARPTLERAEHLAARLAGPPSAAPAYPAGLSAREVEVLRFVADGLTNREIADALSLSERTVQTHVRSILTKTDTPNRTAAAAFARAHGLH